MTDILERIAAGETGPEIDLEVHRALTGDPSWTAEKYLDEADWPYILWARRPDDRIIFGGEIEPIPYTTSLDAAACALPEGWYVRITEDIPRAGEPPHDGFFAQAIRHDLKAVVEAEAPTEIAARLQVAIKERRAEG